MFVPNDFWQPNRDEWKSLATLGALVLAVINVGLIRIIWTRQFDWSDTTYKWLSRTHRTFGYSSIGIMLFIAIVTCIGIIGYGGYATRATWHSWVAITTLSLIVVKIYAVRRGLPEGVTFRRWAMIVAAILTVVVAVIAGTVMRDESSWVLPLFPLAALVAFTAWRRFGSLPVVGTAFVTAIALVFASSAGWWFIDNATKGPLPDVTTVLAEIPGDSASGRTVFNQSCSGCHGSDGGGGVGPDLRSARFAYAFSDRQIAQQIRGGRGIMPGFSAEQIDDEGVADLIAHIRNWYAGG